MATGGGTRVQPWMQAIADATGLPVEVSAVPEGAALGAAFLGRMAAGLETSTADAARWAATERVVEPDPAWTGPMQERYAQVPRAGAGEIVGGIFDDASMVSTVVRVRDVAASVAWYREKLGLEPIHVGADGPEHPIAVYTIAGSVVSLWQLPANQARVRADNDRNSYVVVVIRR